MNIQIEKMLSHVYEIEGLMLVTRRLGEENTPEVITNKIQRKVRELAAMCGVELTSPDPSEPPTTTETPACPETPAHQESPESPTHPGVQARLPEDDYDADETWQHDNGEEFKEVFALDYKEPEHAPVMPGEVPVADREPDEDITVEFIEAEDIPVPEPEDLPIPPTPTEVPADPEPDTPMRVDEKLQRHLSKDIRKALSINDRFRFQRELFAAISPCQTPDFPPLPGLNRCVQPAFLWSAPLAKH